MLIKNLQRLLFTTVVLTSLLFLEGCSMLRGGKITPKDAITTNIEDAYPVASWLENYTKLQTPTKAKTFKLTPGYYTLNIQSYCLKAGTYAPTSGSGYLIAPLKGERATIIKNILRRSEDHPDIKQHDIQRLIWGIETGVNFTNYSSSFQLSVAPLLSAVEIAALSVDYEEWFNKLLPDDLKKFVDQYKDLRNRITDVQTSYDQLEEIAVLTGAAPIGPGSRNIASGPWAYAGNGFYMRALPSGYSRTTLEVIRPAPYVLKRDNKGRIVFFKSGQYRIETSYNDSPGQNILSAPGKPDINIWRFKKIRFLGPGPNDELVIKNKGWILASNQQMSKQAEFQSLRASRFIQLASLDNRIYLAQNDSILPDEWREAKERYDRAKKIKDIIDNISDYHQEQERASRPLSEAAINDITDISHYRDGLETTRDPKNVLGRAKWLREHMGRLSNAWAYVTGVLAGDLPPPGQSPDDFYNNGDNRGDFDPTDNVATPGNTSQQRLGMSRRMK